MRRLNLQLTIKTNDPNLKALFAVESLDTVDSSARAEVVAEDPQPSTDQLVEALLEAGRGSSAAGNRGSASTPPQQLSRTLRMQLLCRAALYCVSVCDFSAAITLADRLLQIGRLSTRRSQIQTATSFEVATFLATARCVSCSHIFQIFPTNCAFCFHGSYVLGKAHQNSIPLCRDVAEREERVSLCLDHFSESCDLMKGHGAAAWPLLASATNGVWNLYMAYPKLTRVYGKPFKRILDALICSDGKNNRNPPNLGIRIEM